MMRHVSRTHRVALDRVFDRINLDPKIKIKYVDTKNQLADLLTKGSSPRDERCLSMFSCSQFLSTMKANTMSKRVQGRKRGEEPATAKPRPTCLI